MHDAAVMSRRAAYAVAAVAVASLLAAGWLLLSPGTARVDSVASDSFSRSAIGHHGIVQLLRAEGELVLQMRQASSVGRFGLLVLAEPDELDDDGLAELESAIDVARATLLVLPKRRGHADPQRPSWLVADGLEDLPHVETVTEQVLDLSGASPPDLVRVQKTSGWRSFAPELPDPDLVAPVQLLEHGSTRMTPLLACDEGVLLARIGELHVLSDPDLLANHGLHRSGNAALVLAALRRIHRGGVYAFDERIHGHRQEPSLFAELGRFPLVLVPAHLLLAFALVLWTAVGRFGRPVASAPALGAGKAVLIDNIVSLLQRSQRPAVALQRYLRHRLRLAATQQRAPSGLDDDAVRAFVLARLPGPQREALQAQLGAVARATSSAAALAIARTAHRLCEEPRHVDH